jgi:hypothetical protein
MIPIAALEGAGFCEKARKQVKRRAAVRKLFKQNV